MPRGRPRKPKPPRIVALGRVPVESDNLTAECNLGVNYRHLSKEATAEITRRLDEGERSIDIGRSMGIPVKRIATLVWHQRQRRQRSYDGGPKEKFDKARQMWAEGYGVQEIAREYSYTRRRMNGVIEWYRKTFGLFPRRRPGYKRASHAKINRENP